MDYYEELAIHRDATTEEIREAYKLAARLLHPDMHREPRLKNLAECQMRRLSDVAAVLLDPRARARYDASLTGALPARLPAKLALVSVPDLLQVAVRNWLWVLLGVMAVGMGVWYALASGPAASPGPSAAASVTPPDPVLPPAPRTARRALPAKGPEVPRSAKALPPSPDFAPPATPDPGFNPALTPAPQPAVELPVEMPKPEQPASPAVQHAPAVPRAAPAAAPRNAASRFEGEWLFSAGAGEDETAGPYPAKYVEFRLRQDGATLTGDYRALHRVADKAISPEVVLHVRGESPAGNSGKLDWESSSGAKGELDVTLRSPNQMQVKWWTTQFGRQEVLGSGMAVLVRLKAP